MYDTHSHSRTKSPKAKVTRSHQKFHSTKSNTKYRLRTKATPRQDNTKRSIHMYQTTRHQSTNPSRKQLHRPPHTNPTQQQPRSPSKITQLTNSTRLQQVQRRPRPIKAYSRSIPKSSQSIRATHQAPQTQQCDHQKNRTNRPHHRLNRPQNTQQLQIPESNCRDQSSHTPLLKIHQSQPTRN